MIFSEESRVALDDAARRRDWPVYMAVLAAARVDQDPVERLPPPGEHSTRAPWPDGFPVPPPIEKLRTLALAHGWEARVGYSRAYKKKGRGNVGGGGNARWVLHHFVAVQVRRSGLGGRAIYACEVDGGRWGVDGVTWGGYRSSITDFTKQLTSGRDAVD